MKVLLTIGIKIPKMLVKLVMIHLEQCQVKPEQVFLRQDRKQHKRMSNLPQESAVWVIESAVVIKILVPRLQRLNFEIIYLAS